MLDLRGDGTQHMSRTMGYCMVTIWLGYLWNYTRPANFTKKRKYLKMHDCLFHFHAQTTNCIWIESNMQATFYPSKMYGSASIDR